MDGYGRSEEKEKEKGADESSAEDSASGEEEPVWERVRRERSQPKKSGRAPQATSGGARGKRFAISSAHVYGDILHYGASAATLPGTKFIVHEDFMIWFHHKEELDRWMHFLELNGGEFDYREAGKIDDAGEATLSLVNKLKHSEPVGFAPAVFNRPHHTNIYIKQLLEQRCPRIVAKQRKVLVWIRAKASYGIHRNTPLALLQSWVKLVMDAGMIPVLIGDKPKFPLSKVKGDCLDLTEFWKWEEDVPGPIRVRKKPFAGTDAIQRQILFLQLLRTDYGVCAQMGVKSGALDAMGLHDLTTVVFDLETDPRLRLRMARLAAHKPNYFVLYPSYEMKDGAILLPDEDRLPGKIVLHETGELNPSGLGKTDNVQNADRKRNAPVEYRQATTSDWERVTAELLVRAKKSV